MSSCFSFVNLLASQRSVEHDSSEPLWFTTQIPEESSVKERRKWSPKEDLILIGAWLNTSKDPIVSNEQKAGAFWQRITEYYNANPFLAGTTPRELGQCKKRWARLNDQVYEAALREQSSGQNEDDVMKADLEIFYNDHKIKFSLEHAWRELRHDTKWISTYMAKETGKDKRKELLDVDGEEVLVDPEARPICVKAAKAAKKKKKSLKEDEFSKLEVMMETKKEIARHQVLERLLAKQEPLSELETTLKLKIISEML